MGTSNFIFKTIDVVTNLLMNPKHLDNVTCETKGNYDLYYADGQIRHKPIIINVHGGGFIGGDKKYRRYWCEVLAQEGWVVINANYRLCPAVTIIEQIKDVWAIVEQVETIAQQYELDRDTVVITGDSAGAFLAAYMVALNTNPELRTKLGVVKNHNLEFTGAMLFCGVYDLPQMVEQGHANVVIKDLAQKITGMTFNDLAALQQYQFYHELSLSQFINNDWCPTLIFYSEKDFLVKGQGELFYQALCAKNIPVKQHHTQKLWHNHCYHLFFLTSISKASLEITKEFLGKMKYHEPL